MVFLKPCVRLGPVFGIHILRQASRSTKVKPHLNPTLHQQQSDCKDIYIHSSYLIVSRLIISNLGMSNISVSSLKYISKEKLADLVRAKSPTVAVIDVRDNDYIGGHIAGGQNVPVATHDYRMPELVRTLKDKDTIVFHCALSQQRGPSSALRYLRERERLLGGNAASAGKDDAGAGETAAVEGQAVYVLEGGFVKWQEV